MSHKAVFIPIPFLVLWGLTAYFSYHALTGPRGYRMLVHKRTELTQLQHKRLYVEGQYTHLKRKVDLLEEHIDQDLLEQELWKKLCFVSKEKKVLFVKSGEEE